MIFGGKPQSFSAVETCWRVAQSRAKPSPPKFPANREKYREFREFGGLLGLLTALSTSFWLTCGPRELVLALNRTGNYQGGIREFNAAYQGIKFPIDVVESGKAAG